MAVTGTPQNWTCHSGGHTVPTDPDAHPWHLHKPPGTGHALWQPHGPVGTGLAPLAATWTPRKQTRPSGSLTAPAV